jgi:uncharacterized repeat protein (TIGR04052 family)
MSQDKSALCVMLCMAPCVALCMALAGCDGTAQDQPDATGDQDAAQRRAVRLVFEAVVGAQPFGCAQAFAGVGVGAQEARFADLKLFVHDIALLRADGAEVPVTLAVEAPWQDGAVALLDFEDAAEACANGSPATRAEVIGDAPAGDYIGVEFRVGVPFAQNHADPSKALPPLDGTAMHWGWQGGYKFLRLDIAGGASVHVGSTGCEGRIGAITGCARPNRPLVSLSGDWEGGVVRLDVGALLSGSDLSAAGTCMSGAREPSCSPIFTRLGLDLDSGEPVDVQGVFSLQPTR